VTYGVYARRRKRIPPQSGEDFLHACLHTHEWCLVTWIIYSFQHMRRRVLFFGTFNVQQEETRSGGKGRGPTKEKASRKEKEANTRGTKIEASM
jgi:hypothetical protein